MSSSSYSFFLAGTMQGSRAGSEQLAQDYREEIGAAILRHAPGSRVYCPRLLLHRALAAEQATIQLAHQQLAQTPTVVTSELPAPLSRLRRAFDNLTALAGRVDVLVAYLPHHEASMGTAAEMWSARCGGAFVVSITSMRQNLAVLATSDVIVPDIAEFSRWLAGSGLERALPAPRAGALPLPEHFPIEQIVNANFNAPMQGVSG